MKRLYGNIAVFLLAAKLRLVIAFNSTLKGKIDGVTRALQKAATPWDRRADDRVLSMMGTEAGASVEKIFEREIRSILRRKDSVEEKERKLAHLKSHLDIPFLADGFKSSIGLKISFAQAHLRLKPTQDDIS